MTVDCRVRQYIEAEGLLERGDAVVMGVSGGADSVCLFLLLAELAAKWELSLAVAHVQHGIRGEEAEEDARFVERLCREYGVAFYREDVDVPVLAAEWKCGEEEAGRRVRHSAYVSCTEKYFGGKAKVALGHHRDDVAETVLLSLVRGTGLTGLAGIRAKTELETDGKTMTVVRPLLCLGRGEIEAYLKHRGQAWRMDATNETDDYARNRIRHSVMPLLVDANPKAVEHIARTSVLAGQAEDFLAGQAENVLAELTDDTEKKGEEKKENGVGWTDGERQAGRAGRAGKNGQNDFKELNKAGLSALHPALQSEVVRRWLIECGVGMRDITHYHISEIVDLAGKQVGKRVELPDGYVVEGGYETLRVRRQSKSKKYSSAVEACEIPKPSIGKTSFATFGEYEFECIARTAEKDWTISAKDENFFSIFINYDKIDKICFRFPRSGDRMVISRDGRHKKLTRILIDAKVPKEARGELVLMADGESIVWVVGVRDCPDYFVTEETETVLECYARRVGDE